MPSLADIGHSSADAGTISSHFRNKMNDNARSNPGSSFIFLMASHTIYVVFYIIISLFYSMLYEHIRIIQHSTPRLQGACEGGIMVSPRR